MLESQLADRDQQRRTLEVSYEQRIEALKRGMELTSRENTDLNYQVGNLQKLYLQEGGGGGGAEPSQLQSLMAIHAEKQV